MVIKRIQVIGWQNSDIERLSLSNVVHNLHMKDSCKAITKKEREVKFKMKEIFISPKVCKDNFSIFNNAFELCLSNLDRVLQRYEKTNLILHWKNYHFMAEEELVSSHVLSSKGINFDKNSSQAHESAEFFKKETKRFHNDQISKTTPQVGDVLLLHIRLKLLQDKLKARWNGPFKDIQWRFGVGSSSLRQPSTI